MNKQYIYLATLAALLYFAPWAALCLYLINVAQSEYKHFFEHKDTETKLKELEKRLSEIEKIDRMRSSFK